MGKKHGKRKHHNSKQEAQNSPEHTAFAHKKEGQPLNAQAADDGGKKADNGEKPSRLERFKAWVGKDKTFTDWAIVLFTGVLAGASIYQFIIMSGQLGEMQRQTEISSRPWLSVQVSPGTDLKWVNGNQAVVGINVSIKNVGKSIAKDIEINAKLFPTSLPVSEDAAQNQRQLCGHPQIGLGKFDLFPDEPPEERVVDISTILPAGTRFIGFYIVGCVSYHYSFGTAIHQTLFAQHLFGPRIHPPEVMEGSTTPADFELGVNVPRDQIQMTRELLGYNEAN